MEDVEERVRYALLEKAARAKAASTTDPIEKREQQFLARHYADAAAMTKP